MKIRWAALAILALALPPALEQRTSAQQTTTIWDGVYTAGQATRAQEFYLQRCGSCHGAGLDGTEIAPGLTDDAFRTKWNDKPLGDLFDIIRGTMPQDQPGSLSRQQTADVLALMLSRGGLPAGQTELATQTDALTAIKFLAKKP